MKTVVGLFETLEQANEAWEALIGSGFEKGDISVIAHNGDVEIHDEATTAGATGGAILGGSLGILAGLAALTIPGVGPALVAGPLVGGLVGAGAGALSGGLVGSLVDAGVAEEDAAVYWEGVRRGGALVVVNTAGDPADTDAAVAILNNQGAVDMKNRGGEWREQGWQGYHTEATPYTDEQRQRYHKLEVLNEDDLTEEELDAGEMSGQYVDYMRKDVTGGQRPRETAGPDDLENAHNFEPSPSEQRINAAEERKR